MKIIIEDSIGGNESAKMLIRLEKEQDNQLTRYEYDAIKLTVHRFLYTAEQLVDSDSSSFEKK